MKKILATLMIATMLSGCANNKTIDNVKYEPYGVFNLENHNPKIHYEVSIGGIVLSIVLIETVIVPVVIFGWYLYEPTCKLPENAQPGQSC